MRVALGDICTIRSSLIDPKLAEYRDLPHVAPDSIERGGGGLMRIRSASEDGVTSGKFRFEPGDVLYSKIRPNLNKVVRVDFAGLCSADMYAIEVDESRAASGFILQLLRGSSFLDYATSLSNRANIPKLNRGQVLGFEFELPPLGKQCLITAILDQADALRAKRRQVHAHLKSLTQSIFYDMFGDPGTASRTVSFGEVASLRAGRNLVADDAASDSIFRVLKISSVTSGDFKPSESKPLPVGYEPPASHLVRHGDLLMSRANTAELVGAVAYVRHAPSNLALPDKLWRFHWLRTGSVPIFYHALFQTPSVRRRISRMSSGTGGSMKNIAKSKLETLVLPDVAAEQQRLFERWVAAIPRPDPAALDKLFLSLQARAFEGAI